VVVFEGGVGGVTGGFGAGNVISKGGISVLGHLPRKIHISKGSKIIWPTIIITSCYLWK